jgi:apolipoprotein N-acyltransferase
MKNYGGLGALAASGVFLAFCALLALYFALFGGLAWLLLRRGPGPSGLANQGPGPRPGCVPDGLLLWAIPALWVGIELLRSVLLTGLPFLLLGYTMADHLLIAQLARVGGVYLLSFVVALFNTGVFLLVRNPRRRLGMALGGVIFLLGLLLLAGSYVPAARPNQTAYLVQAYAPLDESWTRDATRLLVLNLEQRTLAAWARNQSRPGLIVWPEIPASLYYEDDPEMRRQVDYLARQMHSEMLLNVIAFADAARQQPLNSAVLIGPNGEPQGRYDKIHLVPFGEYVPYRPVFFFAGRLTAEVGDFVPGKRAAPIGSEHQIAALVCYESIFPDLVRQFTAGGAEVLVNLSNDAWYGQSAAREQLLLMSRMRAIENGRWLLRATNTGITAVVDPYGRMETFPPDKRAVYTVRFAYRSGTTTYVALGHWFAMLAAVAAALLVLQSGLWRAARGA